MEPTSSRLPVSSAFTISLPEWCIQANEQLPEFIPSVEDRMAHVIAFSRRNFEEGTGGPFAAGVFERDSGRVIVIGVNRVLESGYSSSHAEVVAISLAQQILKSHDLGADGMPIYQLVVNWLPCAMCFGATCWSGVRSLAVAGSGPELESITGFDEGPRHPDWLNELQMRGIEVIDNVLKEEAMQVYRSFAQSGAVVYNARSGTTEI
jgi:tRNA(Arg) A34 adenosine deaminase TadA